MLVHVHIWYEYVFPVRALISHAEHSVHLAGSSMVERSHVPLLCYTPRSTTHQKHPLNITNCTMTRIIQGSEFDISWYYLALRLWKDSHAQMAYLPPLPPCSLAALQPRGGPQKLQHASGGRTLHQIRGNYGELEVSIGFPKGSTNHPSCWSFEIWWNNEICLVGHPFAAP
jgi:hypothetical protein